MDRFSGTRSGAALQHLGLSEGGRCGRDAAERRRAGGVRQRHRSRARQGRCRLRHRCLSRCAAGIAHLVRFDRGARRCRGADAVARLGLCGGQGSAGEGGLNAMSAASFADPLTDRLVAFVRGIGINVRTATLPEKTVLPGLDIRDGAILVDEARLTHPGDILHEAGHLAVTDPAERDAPQLSPTPAEEMASIAWSYAALRHLALEPAVVFHDNGYKGGSASIIENFTAGRYFGVPLLQYYGMAVEPRRAAETGAKP